MMPWGVLEAALNLAILIIQGIPEEQRMATAKVWFWRTWPIMKIGLKPDVVAEVERIMKGSQE